METAAPRLSPVVRRWLIACGIVVAIHTSLVLLLVVGGMSTESNPDSSPWMILTIVIWFLDFPAILLTHKLEPGWLQLILAVSLATLQWILITSLVFWFWWGVHRVGLKVDAKLGRR